MIGKNAVELEYPDHTKIHKFVNVSRTVPYYEQPSDNTQPVQTRPESVPIIEGDVFIVDKILNYRKRGRGYQFLTLMKRSPEYDAESQPAKDFRDTDGTINDKFLSYIKSKS